MNNAGNINREWYDNSLANADAETIRRWFIVLTNDADVAIDAELSVYASGAWLSQDDIDDACRRIDASFLPGL